jgi:hypothetical protein
MISKRYHNDFEECPLIRQRIAIGLHSCVLLTLLFTVLLGAIVLSDVPQARLKQIFMVSFTGEVAVYKRKSGGYYFTAVFALDDAT